MGLQLSDSQVCNRLAIVTAIGSLLVTALMLFCELEINVFVPAALLATCNFRVMALQAANGAYDNKSEEYVYQRTLLWLFLPVFGFFVIAMLHVFTFGTYPGKNIRLESLFRLAAWLGMAAAYLSGPLMWLYTVRHYRAKRAKGKRKHAEALTVKELLADQGKVVAESPNYEPPPSQVHPRFTTYD